MRRRLLFVVLLLFTAVACRQDPAPTPTAVADAEASESSILTLPSLKAADLNQRRLHVVATTSILGDVVAQVGGEHIELLVLMEPGQDPHSYELSARDLTAVADADVLFVNGWNLEESLLRSLENAAADTAVVPASAGIQPQTFTGEDLHAGETAENSETEPLGSGLDPHVWFDPTLVGQWVDNIEQVLSTVDPAHATGYANQADAYRQQLTALDTYLESQVALIPQENRVLVTNHHALGYFASRYGFTVAGTILPAGSTLAEPSSSSLAALVETMKANGLCTLFFESTNASELAQALVNDLPHCDYVTILPLFTGALGPAGGPADNYIGMMQSNMGFILAGLGPPELTH